MTVAIANRGAPFAAHENTLEAFRAAVEMGAPAIELAAGLAAFVTNRPDLARDALGA